MSEKDRVLLTVKEFSQKHPAFPPGGLRHLIFNAAPRVSARNQHVPGNGLTESGAILRIGRKVLIDEDRFFVWIDSQQRESKPTLSAVRDSDS